MAIASRLHSIPVGALFCWQSRPSLTRRRLMVVASGGDLSSSSCGAVVVWYKHDLRVDDHPGLMVAASQQQPVVPLYVFDPRIISVAGQEGPPVLFAHGFGAFLEHFRENISAMANSGHRIWGITLLGFGRSEKPNVLYNEPMWAELLRDFIVDVVREPVHLVGNSIGGYFVAAAAAFWPSLAKSLVLVNTAGSVGPDYLHMQLMERRASSGFAWIGSRLLLLYLRSRAADILKKCYPVKPERVDNWLVNEILRASYDPGAIVVLESVFNFKLPVPLNYLLDWFGGNVLFIQGVRDPLSKSRERLSMIREYCSLATIKEIDAGHCPHDECPEEVNRLLREWIQTAELSNQTMRSN